MEKWNDEKNWDIKEPIWKQAIEYANKYHSAAGQYRIGKNGEKLPYITHIQEVMRILIDEANIKSYDVLTVTALHDVIEDTECSYEDVKREYGEYIADAVELLTRKEGQSFEEYSEKIFTSEKYPWVSVIKLADRIHNLRTYPEVKDSKKSRYKLEETKKYIEPYADEKSPILAKKLREAMEELEEILSKEENEK